MRNPQRKVKMAKEIRVGYISWSSKNPDVCWQGYEFEKTNPYWALDGFRELDHFWTRNGEFYTLHVIYQTRESTRSLKE